MIRGHVRGMFGEPVPRSFGGPYGYEYESYPETDEVAPSSGSKDGRHGYIRTRLAPPLPRPAESHNYFEITERSGPYESYDSGSSKGSRDLLRSGFGSSYDDGFDSSLPSNRFYSEESTWDSCYPSSRVRSGFLDNGGGAGCSSFASDSSPRTRLAPVGSRGRGMPAYPQNGFAGRSDDVGGPPPFRGRGRGFIAGGAGIRQPLNAGPQPQNYMERTEPPMGHFGPPPPEFHAGYLHPHPAPYPALPTAHGAGMKRKMRMLMLPSVYAKKKRKLAPVIKKEQEMNNSEEGPEAEEGQPEEDEDSTEVKQRKARREKQKRRREKEIEKYGDMHRLAFTCAFCKVRTCEEEEMEEHFASSFHQQTLAHIQKQAKFDDTAITFLHDSMVNKFRKTALRKLTSTGPEPSLEVIQQEISKVVVEEACLSKVEMIHCMACRVHVPAALLSVQQHLKSSDHKNNKLKFTETQKRESVLTATSIMTNPIVKARYEKYLKGENPFEDEIKELAEEAQGVQADGDVNQ